MTFPNLLHLDYLASAFLMCLPVVISLFALVFWYRSLKRARMIEDIPTSRTRSAAQGYVELIGHQYPAPGHTVHAPLTGKPCTWWRYKIEQYKWDYTHPGQKELVTLEEATSTTPILFKDGKGHMLVDPRGAEVMPTARQRWQSSTDPSSRPMEVLNERKGRFVYAEERMYEGSRLYVSGELHTPGSRHSSISFDDALNDLLARWKRNQPELIQRFDTDSDGRIDSNEWDIARQAARDELSTRLHPPDSGTAIDIIRKPDDGQPFLLAAKSQIELARKYRYYARNNLLLFIVMGAVSLYLVYEIFLKR